MVMAATAALRANPFADREEIKERLGGNICRCTGYQKIFDAVELARDVQNGSLPATALMEDEADKRDFIGKNVRRIDTPSKVSGRLKYAADMTMLGMLHVQVLRSPHAHARIVSIDTSAAEAIEGVEGIITSTDVPGEDGLACSSTTNRSWRTTKSATSVRLWRQSPQKIRSLPSRRCLQSMLFTRRCRPCFDPDEAMRPGRTGAARLRTG